MTKLIYTSVALWFNKLVTSYYYIVYCIIQRSSPSLSISFFDSLNLFSKSSFTRMM